MRRTALLAGLCLLLAGCTSVGSPAPLGVGGSAPVLDAISERTLVQDGFPVVIPEFHFHDADGDVRFLARELVATDGPYGDTKGATITFPAALQQRGAIFAGRWACGPNRYYATMRAYLIDRSGQRSNAMTYTIHCNGG